MESLGLDDNRFMDYQNRFMITNNWIYPRVYQVTKVIDFAPQGVVKYSAKQDDFDESRDNPSLHICNYYENDGTIRAATPEPQDWPDVYTSSISLMVLDENEELVPSEETTATVGLGEMLYFKVTFSSPGVEPEWRIKLVDEDDPKKSYYENLMKLNEFDKDIVSVKPGKAYSLKGKKFILFVNDLNGNYYSEFPIEVKED